MSRRWLATALAVVITATLVADAGVVLARTGEPGTAATPSVSTLVPDKLEPVLPGLEAFVEQARGLQYKRPPKVALVADDQFEKLFQGDGSDSEADPQDMQTSLGELRALGLIEGQINVDAVAQQQTSGVIGFYDSKTKELYVRGVDATPYVQRTLVHELTHALDDQHFGLERPELDTPERSDALSAFQALVEGNATTVENEWYDSRPQEDRDAIDAAESATGGGADDGSEPDVFTKEAAFPYSVGPDFVAALRDAGGQTRLDAAFEHPPTTTEQILYPRRFLDGESALAVPPPPADGDVVDQGSFGELGLFLIADASVSHQAAGRASAGWGGDTYRAWRDGNRTCIRANIAMDTSADTAELLETLQAWAAQHPGASVSGSGPLQITNCG